MKLSSKLLLGLFLALIVAMFGAAVSLRRQYDAIDKSDPYARWQKKPLPRFRAVQLSGPSSAIVQVMPGPSPRLLADTLNQMERTQYTYNVERDTLFVQVAPVEGWYFRPDDEDDDVRSPQLVVQAPGIVAVTTVNANCQIADYKGETLTLQQRGRGGRMLLDKVAVGQLTATLAGRSQLTLAPFNNQIRQARITLADSARLHQYCDFTDGLTLSASPTASLRLTGRAIAQAAAR